MGYYVEANPLSRYSKNELGTRTFEAVAVSSRADMLSLERVLTSRFGGAENKSWANSIKNNTSPDAIIAAFKAARRGCIKIL